MSEAVETRRELVRARRRIAMRVGLAAIALASLVTGVTACIFDRGDYQGGGRLDKGATAKTAEPEPTLSDTVPTATNTAPNPNGLDAATGG
jgi:hypothetical protein